jgi:hypothetical protein
MTMPKDTGPKPPREEGGSDGAAELPSGRQEPAKPIRPDRFIWSGDEAKAVFGDEPEKRPGRKAPRK